MTPVKKAVSVLRADPSGRAVKGGLQPLDAGIAGSNPAEGMNVRLLCLLCVLYVAVSLKSLSFIQKSSTLCVCVCVCVCVFFFYKAQNRGGLAPISFVVPQKQKVLHVTGKNEKVYKTICFN